MEVGVQSVESRAIGAAEALGVGTRFEPVQLGAIAARRLRYPWLGRLIYASRRGCGERNGILSAKVPWSSVHRGFKLRGAQPAYQNPDPVIASTMAGLGALRGIPLRALLINESDLRSAAVDTQIDTGDEARITRWRQLDSMACVHKEGKMRQHERNQAATSPLSRTIPGERERRRRCVATTKRHLTVLP